MEEGRGNGTSQSEDDRMAALKNLRSAASISMSPELFEKLYLSPQTPVKGNLRQTFANPTPIPLIGLVMSLTPFACNLMGWRGAGGGGAAHIPVYFFMGGVLMVLGSIYEWILGNSFASVVFATFGGFWLSFGGTLNPSFAAFSSYAPADAASPAEGLQTEAFNASFGFWLLWFALVCVIFLVCSLRTNVIFVAIFFTFDIGMGLLIAAYWVLAEDMTGNAALADKLMVGCGALFFATAMAGWYLITSILLAIVDFPIQLPVGDLSTVVKGKSQRMRQ